ncbi:coiled-coil domain-containing protein 9 [Spea bombifrons]|uniref:coiled-coil domain-containing protein 9 n=1 Tax=Spea bombifrons TaxID=233779 RepID=UPI0023497530|nr:coiled-coil domain-containing protein 9 [Spea bombifrons]
MASVVDLKSKEEKDAELDRKIEALRKKNEALIRRHQLIEEDKKRAEQEGIAVTTPRKGKNAETEPDKARKEKENFSITVAGEKRVINEGKSPKSSPRMDVSPRSPTQRITGRAGRSPQAEKPEEIFQGGSEISPPSDKPARGRRGPGAEMSRRGQEGDLPKRSPRGNRDGSPGERWASSPRGGPAGDRGGRGPGRGGGAPGRGGDAAGPDRKVKEWEERRRQNIEKMNEEMEMIAEYERSRRDGTREKNPIRNFLDDPRRSGPVADIDRKEGSRRHIRNWGGPDFEKVKTGMDRDKENHGRRPGPKSQVDMTMSMTGRERAEYMRWKKEREQIDQERLERHRKPTGQWRREWDAEKNDTMFKDDASPRVEEEPAGRRDKGRRGPPKPHTIGEFLPESLTGFSQKRAQNRGKERTKPYSMHDSRWEDPEEKKEEATVDGAEKETCLEKAEEPKSQEPRKQSKLKSSPAPAEGKEEHEDDGEWTDASGDEEEDEDDEGSSEAEQDSADEGHSEASPVTPQPAPKEQRVPPPHETPKLTIPPPSESPEEKTLEMKPTSPFSPEGHRSVTDWGEEMEQLSNRGSSNEDSPPQNQGSGARTQARSALSD